MSIPAVTYEMARRDRSVRQQYLDSLLPKCPDSVSRILDATTFAKTLGCIDDLVESGYITDLEAGIKRLQIIDVYNDSAFVVSHVPRMFGRGQSHPILVTNAIRVLDKERYFLSVLLDHEVIHTKHLKYGIRLDDETILDFQNVEEARPEIIVYLGEFLCYKNQIDAALKRGLSETFTQGLCLGRNEYLRNLLYMNQVNELEEKIQEFAWNLDII